MIIYILAFALSLALLIPYVNSKKKLIKNIYLALSMLPLMFISGFRYGVGTDYFSRYVFDFNNILNGVDVENFEYGFKLIIKFCQLFSDKYYLLFIITSFIIILFIFLGIKDSSNNFIISLVLFFIGGYFFLSMNMIRQFMSMAVIFYSFKYVLRTGYKNIILFLIFTIIAFFIHSSSAVVLVLPLFKKLRLNFKPWIVLLVIALIILLKTPIYSLAEFLLSYTRFNVYLVGHYAKSDITFLFIISNFIIYIFMFLSCRTKTNKIMNIDIKDSIFLSIQFTTVILFSMSAMHMLFPRIAYYFSIFQIISIPYFVETLDYEYVKKIINKKKNLFISKFIKKSVCYACIILFFSTILFYTNVMHNDQGVIPYRNILLESGDIYEE